CTAEPPIAAENRQGSTRSVRHDGRAVVEDAVGIGEHDRLRPFLAVVTCSVLGPGLSRAAGQRMMSEKKPQTAIVSHCDAGHALGPLHLLQDVVDFGSRLLKAAVGIALHDDASALVK